MDTIAGSSGSFVDDTAKELLGQTCAHPTNNNSHADVLSSRKANFLKVHGHNYGYPESDVEFEPMVKREFSRLNGSVFADHAGATLFAESQLKAIWEDLAKNLYGNPHSQNEGSDKTSNVVEATRATVLAMCNAPTREYKCVFTAGATAALKLVGETFPWSSESYFLYTQENHNSVLGIRQYALDCGSTAVAVDLESSKMPGDHGSLRAPVAGRDDGSVFTGDLHIRGESGDDYERRRVEITSPTAAKPDGLPVRPDGKRAERPNKAAARGFRSTCTPDASRGRKDGHAERPEDYVVRSGELALASNGRDGTNAFAREENQIGTSARYSPDRNADKADGEGVDTWNKCSCSTNGCWTIHQRGLQRRQRKFLSSFMEGEAAAVKPPDDTPDSGGVPDVGGRGEAVVKDGDDSNKDEPVRQSQGRFGHFRQRLLSYLGFGEVASPPLHGDEKIGRRASDNMPASEESDRHGNLQAVWKGTRGRDEPFHLFAFPAECNFSGQRFDLEIVNQVHADRVHGLPMGRCMVLVDAAKACGTMPPDLSVHPADFVVVSFYKIFGYPTGLGALLIRNDAAQILRKRYFGGGTVGISIADIDFMRRRETTEEWLEDGTLPFLEIASIPHGYRFLNRLGTADAISRHTGALTRYAAAELKGLRHGNGEEVCVLYGNHGLYTKYGDSGKQEGGGYAQGPVIAFNLKRSDGSFIGKREVEKLAALNSIQLRTGCFCNPGSCAKHLGLTHGDMRSYYNEENVCWDDHDIIQGRPTGAIRISFGYMSTFEDVEVVIRFVRDFFAERIPTLQCAPSYCSTWPRAEEGRLGNGSREIMVETATDSHDLRSSDCAAPGTESAMGEVGGRLMRATIASRPIQLQMIVFYPIKSCAGQSVTAWPIGDNGLLYDREWLLMDPSSGNALTQKKMPSLALVKPWVDLVSQVLVVTAPGKASLRIPISQSTVRSIDHGVRVCGTRASGSAYGMEVAAWFTEVTGVACTLVRQQKWSRVMSSQRRKPGSGSKDSTTSRSNGYVSLTDDAGSRASKGASPATVVGVGGDKSSKGIGFANEAQFLLVSQSSVDDLNKRIRNRLPENNGNTADDLQKGNISALQFRPNLVLSGSVPYAEDTWQAIQTCGETLVVHGICRRCQMVNINQATAKMGGNEPLLTLATYRRQQGGISFGVLLAHQTSSNPRKDHGTSARESAAIRMGIHTIEDRCVTERVATESKLNLDVDVDKHVNGNADNDVDKHMNGSADKDVDKALDNDVNEDADKYLGNHAEEELDKDVVKHVSVDKDVDKVVDKDVDKVVDKDIDNGKDEAQGITPSIQWLKQRWPIVLRTCTTVVPLKKAASDRSIEKVQKDP